MKSLTRTGRVLALLVCLCAPCLLAHADEWHFADVERVVAIGDVHGAYDALVATLQNAEVIDDDLAWSGGTTHLVSTGDLLDRGAGSRRVMDLMMRLEGEAQRAGGRVHQLLGNHEVMNLIGDLRYVADEEYAAFRDVESANEREGWFRRSRLGISKLIDEVTARRKFDKIAPPGYFGHRQAFRPDGYYGKWLLEKPFMIVINDIAYVHGGAPAYVGEYGLAGVNKGLKADLIAYLEAFEAFVEQRVLSPVDRFKELPAKLVPMLEEGELKGDVAEAAVNLLEFSRTPLQGQAGPTWYRGTAMCNRFVEGDRLSRALDEVGATRIVIGHTTTANRRIQQRFNGRVLEIDTGMLYEEYGGSGNALLVDRGVLSVVNEDQAVVVSLVEHPLRIGHSNVARDDAHLERMLESGSIKDAIDDGATWQLVQVTSGKKTMLASFRALPSNGLFVPELAAYRLDRRLGLEMVPVTVRRTIAGRRGTLQFVPVLSLTERQRVEGDYGKGAICALEKQKDAMVVFDALVNNLARTPSSMVYDTEDWMLVLVDHENTFGTSGRLPSDLEHVNLDVGGEWRAALRELSDEVIRTEFRDVLDEQRMLALGKRRDALIERAD